VTFLDKHGGLDIYKNGKYHELTEEDLDNGIGYNCPQTIDELIEKISGTDLKIKVKI